MIRTIITLEIKYSCNYSDCRFQKYDQCFEKYEFLKTQINGDSCFHQIPTISQHFFIVFEWGKVLESPMDKYEVKCNEK